MSDLPLGHPGRESQNDLTSRIEPIYPVVRQGEYRPSHRKNLNSPFTPLNASCFLCSNSLVCVFRRTADEYLQARRVGRVDEPTAIANPLDQRGLRPQP